MCAREPLKRFAAQTSAGEQCPPLRKRIGSTCGTMQASSPTNGVERYTQNDMFALVEIVGAHIVRPLT